MYLGSINVHAGAITPQRDTLTWQATEYEVFAYYEHDRELLNNKSEHIVKKKTCALKHAKWTFFLKN